MGKGIVWSSGGCFNKQDGLSDRVKDRSAIYK